MRVIVFGPTSKLGRHVWRKALDSGHQVTVFGRLVKTLTKEEPALRIKMGDSFDAGAMSGAISRHDAVIVCLGTDQRELVTPSTATDIVVDAMVRHDVKRLIVVTTTGDGLDEKKISFWARVFYMWIGGAALRLLGGHGPQEAVVRDSPLDWTIVRVPVINDKLAPGFTERSTNLSREDGAEFIVKQLTDLTNNNKAITAPSSDGPPPSSEPTPAEPTPAEPTPSEPPSRGKFEDYPLAPGGGSKKRRSWRSS